jgi:hypothetical protein
LQMTALLFGKYDGGWKSTLAYGDDGFLQRIK